MKQARGFTLIELMITLTIMAAMLTIAVPGLQQFLISGNLISLSNDIMASLNFARSEAVKRGLSVSLCPSANRTTCTGSWSQGWIVFVDNNSDGELNGSDALLRVHEAASASYSVTSTLVDGASATVAFVTYARNGIANDTGKFALCYNSDESQAKVISVPLTRPRFDSSTSLTNCETP